MKKPRHLMPDDGVYCAGATGLEPATYGFGDRCATNCATPLFFYSLMPKHQALKTLPEP